MAWALVFSLETQLGQQAAGAIRKCHVIFLIKAKHAHIPQHLLWPLWFQPLCGHHRHVQAESSEMTDSARPSRGSVSEPHSAKSLNLQPSKGQPGIWETKKESYLHRTLLQPGLGLLFPPHTWHNVTSGSCAVVWRLPVMPHRTILKCQAGFTRSTPNPAGRWVRNLAPNPVKAHFRLLTLLPFPAHAEMIYGCHSFSPHWLQAPGVSPAKQSTLGSHTNWRLKISTLKSILGPSFSKFSKPRFFHL